MAMRRATSLPQSNHLVRVLFQKPTLFVVRSLNSSLYVCHASQRKKNAIRNIAVHHRRERVLTREKNHTGVMAASSSTHCKHSKTNKDDSEFKNVVDNGLDLKLKKVAVIGKMTRYEFEKQRYENYSEDQFKEVLKIRGSSYHALLSKHNKHLKNMEYLKNVLMKRGIEFKISSRGNTSFTKECVEWADAVITAGGDGTFLSTATKIKNSHKPLIGINTAPDRSEGHLCLPAKYTTNLDEALDKLSQGNFKWLFRQRIRITLSGCKTDCRPIDNGAMLKERMLGNYKEAPSPYFSDDEFEDKEQESTSSSVLTKHPFKEVLPVLALNEIFMGESIASVPSLYEIQVDDKVPEKQKSSGVCICTGTGSTAWSYNICRLHSSSVHTLLNIAQKLQSKKHPNKLLKQLESTVINEATEEFAHSFIFKPNEPQMLFSVRDPMQNKVYFCNQPYGWAKSLVIRSRCWDATLCIDGDISFAFNDGATAHFEILPQDALRTVVLDEDDNLSD
uniref:NAD(+) kinase n=1 Tax=Phallusia mammillata TaxID=59560 RepID=A0A6F9DCW8_9ASCI|nr:NAD kinase 2, mitochondrial [Phallusia mammillata]